MPSATEFRRGDRVETRRGGTVPEEYRQRRAEVRRIRADGLIEIKFANEPPNGLHFRHCGDEPARWWRPDELRLVERPMRVQVGATVMIADPAYSQPGRGAVDPTFYGQEATIVGEYDPEYINGMWRVQLLSDPGERQIIHEDYLTVTADPTPPRWREGDEVVVSNPAYATPRAMTYELAYGPLFGQLVQIQRQRPGGAWDVYNPATGDTGRVHENWLTDFTDTGTPLFEVGQVVRIGRQPSSLGTRDSRIEGWAGKRALIVEHPSPSRFLLRRLDNMQQTVIHQSHLALAETPRPRVGATVRVPESIMHRREGGWLHQGLSCQVGTVTMYHDNSTHRGYAGNAVVVMLTGEQHLVWPALLTEIDPAEAREVLWRRATVRIAYGDDVDDSVAGRLGIVSEIRGDNVVLSMRGHRSQMANVHRRHLTRVDPVSNLESGHLHCATCLVGVPAESAFVAEGSYYCDDCVAGCSRCSRVVPINREQAWYRDGGWRCDQCAGECAACSTVLARSELREDESGRLYCSDHYRECEDDGCDNIVTGGGRTCRSCQSDRGHDGLGGYRHTRPQMWLGGPVRQSGGYYIGFEHEVSASGDYPLRPLRLWAQEHLGSRSALDPKSDSSVRGFEIATQPMTPAFFEDVDWDSYMELLDELYPVDEEPDTHGLHVHIGRQAFRTEKMVRNVRGVRLDKPTKMLVTDSGMLAAYTYLLSTGHHHLTRIGRRDSSQWAPRVPQPVKAAIWHDGSEVRRGKQWQRIHDNGGARVPRGAVNLTSQDTIEIRVARSTRSAADLRAAVRVVYLGAEYVRHLRGQGSISPKGLNWASFAEWVGENMPDAYESIAGSARPAAHPVTAMSATLMDAFRTPEAEAARESGEVNSLMEVAPVTAVVAPSLSVGQQVVLASPAYATPNTEQACPPETWGAMGTLRRRDSGGRWVVRVNGYNHYVHENWLTVVTDSPFPLVG